jgi:hypothetical protein
MRDKCAGHDNGKHDGRIEGVAGNQQADAGGHFQKAGEVPEPLTEADLGEQVDHYGGTGQLGAAHPDKEQGGETGKNPERGEAASYGAAGSALVVIIRFPLESRELVATFYIDVDILDVNGMTT